MGTGHIKRHECRKEVFRDEKWLLRSELWRGRGRDTEREERRDSDNVRDAMPHRKTTAKEEREHYK